MLREASYYVKMALGWCKFVRTPPAGDARSVVRQGVVDREKNFLDLLRRGVFESSASPYCKLFDWAGCTYADVEQDVGAWGSKRLWRGFGAPEST